jgi:hypothetical protein
MITVSAVVKQSDTAPPRVCNSVVITLLERKWIREKDGNKDGKEFKKGRN